MAFDLRGAERARVGTFGGSNEVNSTRLGKKTKPSRHKDVDFCSYEHEFPGE